MGAPPPPPSPPTLVSASAKQMSLSWAAVSPDMLYTLQMADPLTGHGFLNAYHGPDNEHACTGLMRSTTYRFRVRDSNREHNHARSALSRDVTRVDWTESLLTFPFGHSCRRRTTTARPAGQKKRATRRRPTGRPLPPGPASKVAFNRTACASAGIRRPTREAPRSSSTFSSWIRARDSGTCGRAPSASSRASDSRPAPRTG